MVTVRAPATSANLGSGYDVFGVALAGPADVVTVDRADTTTIEVVGAGSQYIPEDPGENTAGVVADALDVTASIHIDKGIRPASGLGSSAASAAATAVALDALYSLGTTDEGLVDAAAAGEAAVAGTAHADNVAPAILGGFTAVATDGIVHTDTPVGVPVVACLPDLVVSTRDARAVVPDTVTTTDLTTVVGDAATLVAGMYDADPALIGRGMTPDPASRARSDLVEGYDAVVTAARDAGATGVTVSGAGPAVLAVPRVGADRRVAAAMVDAFEDRGVAARAYRTTIGAGARFLS
ncbi:MAG: homoserine kinase [Halobacteriaceae archaeon]